MRSRTALLDATGPTAADDDGATRRHACPLADCPHAARTRDDLYCHLLVEHRKSDLGAALVDREG